MKPIGAFAALWIAVPEKSAAVSPESSGGAIGRSGAGVQDDQHPNLQVRIAGHDRRKLNRQRMAWILLLESPLVPKGSNPTVGVFCRQARKMLNWAVTG